MLTDAFGIVVTVAMTPLVSIQILGLIHQYKSRNGPEEISTGGEDFIIVYEEER